MNFTASDGLDLAYYIDAFTDPWREPETLIMLHATMGHSGRFFAMVPMLARHFGVVRLDLRGHGRSAVPRPDQRLDMDRLVADVRELMDHLELARAHVLGYSAGGFIAQHLAMHHPECVASLSLFGSSAGLKNSKIGAWIDAIRIKGLRALVAETMADRFDRRTPRALQSWFLDQIAATDPTLITRFMALTSELEWSAQLGKILCPTLLVVPKGDTIGSDTLYQPMRDGIKDLTFIRLDVAGHNICDMLPERCAAEVLRFLGKAELHSDSWATTNPS